MFCKNGARAWNGTQTKRGEPGVIPQYGLQ